MKTAALIIMTNLPEKNGVIASMLNAGSVSVGQRMIASFQCARISRRLYVNSWGRDKEQIIASRVGVKAPARFLCTTEADSVSEIAEVTHSKTDSFQDLVLLLQPSIKPFDHGTSIEFRISLNQLRYAFVQSLNSGRSMTSTASSQSASIFAPGIAGG